MVIDTLENLEKYVALNPLFAQAVAFVRSHDLNTLAVGKIALQGNDLVVNVAQTSPKSQAEAKLETHRKMIDIQIPLSGTETMGYTPAAALPASAYDEAKDISFFEGAAEDYFAVRPGMFAIFFPQDGHAPGITPVGVKKVIIKILA